MKLNQRTAKILKAIHIFCITLWIGGLITFLPLAYGIRMEEVESTYTTYLNMRSIAWNVIGWGGIGSFITGLLNGLLTQWGLFKHRWVTLKFLATIGMILAGMFYTEQKMLSNITLLENTKMPLHDAAFLANHDAIKMVVPIQLSVFFLIVLLSVVKPWMRRT